MATVAIPKNAASAATAFPVGSAYPGIVEFSLTEDAYVVFGGAAAAATTSSRVLNKGTYVYSVLEGQTHFSVRAVKTAGVATAVELR